MCLTYYLTPAKFEFGWIENKHQHF